MFPNDLMISKTYLLRAPYSLVVNATHACVCIALAQCATHPYMY